MNSSRTGVETMRLGVDVGRVIIALEQRDASRDRSLIACPTWRDVLRRLD